ncbi:lysozyme inhibitor LprI family protein [Spirulina sp. 06S082]|uniref:lysozyme inhibitor LprI family protein n=1 Tax=Spirulina sp. 06S082 TaxID=3110248 RepID=UPI002B1F64C9|nr:lysozyme inhibitor LprI family protein [Spirulina sp. 06S082]MEA5470247.1 lysozyme inhibitor LprI family protein [Spirulina sp. 06S082]
MKITKNVFIFTATLILVVFSGCSTPEQTRATSPDSINGRTSGAIATEQFSPIASSPITTLNHTTPKIAQNPLKEDEKLNCEEPQTQLEMNLCATKEAGEADAKLNRVYGQLRDKVKDTAQETRLIAAQTAWITFRDADCEYSQRRYDGGSIMPAIYALCVIDLTEKRTQTLEDYLEEG